jgi:hypothetical protein|tara:strand:+ start:2118 stop:2531 length:414 start_codon:yes stop_codon:yes gene_type:complete
MNPRKKLFVFVVFFLVALVYYRLKVLLVYGDGEVSFLREVTGLTIHHYHYGLIIVLIASLLLIFYRVNGFSVGLMGFGLGSVFDSFVSRLFSVGDRVREITVYNGSFVLTIIVFVNVVILSFVFYLVGIRSNRKQKS